MNQELKFKARNNKALTNQVVQELLRHKPNFPLYKILDDLPFVDEFQIIPALALKNHLRKLYPYADESKIQLFITLADINGDSKIEVVELFQFFTEIEQGKVTSEVVFGNIA